MTPKTNYWTLVFSFLFAVIVMAITFPLVMAHPGQMIPGLGGDAGKNMFVYLYHILYGKGVWFSGMNYPYGENIMYTDGQPLLSVFLSHFKHISIQQAVAAMWLLMMLSYVLAIEYTTKVLLFLDVKPFIAVVFAGMVVAMDPQVFRTAGHFGLSYACIIPMLVYWTLRYNVSAGGRNMVYIVLLGIIATFLHPYLAAIISVWLACYIVGYILFTRQRPLFLFTHVLFPLAAVIILFSVTAIFVKCTDPIKDRPIVPYGLTDYCTTGEHIFTSHFSPFWKFFEDHFPSFTCGSGEEGFCYLGLVTIILIVVSLTSWLITKWRKPVAVITVNGSMQPVWFFITFAVLLLAMGVPFVWGLDWIVYYLPPIRQFRTLGRFSWIFYYLTAIYGVWLLSGYYSRFLMKGKKVFAYALAGIAMLVWGFEASGYIIAQRKALIGSPDNYDRVLGLKNENWNDFLSKNRYGAGQFQAILLLPFFNVGSDKLWLEDDWVFAEMATGFVTGIQLHLPIVDALMARSSWAITEKQVRTVGGPYAHKDMLSDLPDKRPFLLLFHRADELDPDQRYLLEASDSIGTFNEWQAYACYPSRITMEDNKRTDSIEALLPRFADGDTCIRFTGSWYVQHFETGQSDAAFWGNTAQSRINVFDTAIATIPVIPGCPGQLYEFSCWFLLGNKNYRSPYFKLELLDSHGEVRVREDLLSKKSTDNKGLWFRASHFFRIPPGCEKVRCVLFNEPHDTYEVMDEMMLRPADALIVSKSGSHVMANNHWIK